MYLQTFLSLLLLPLALASPLVPRATFSSFAGTNAYWLPFLTSDADIDLTLAAAQRAGLTNIRTWGFYDSTDCSGIHFQCWSSSTPSINYNSNGLGRLDVVVRTAEKYGIKLIIPLVNNWGDYGGMDVYVSKLGGNGHSSFYTDSKIIQAYKNYIQAVVNRYKGSSAIFAWELANESRCNGCQTSVITNWARDISGYIKSLDSAHYVALGDEGFMVGGSTYPYQGGEGIDFVENLKISTLDFGTVHLYTTSWGQSYEWGTTWITDHANACKAAGKACVLEEYGVGEDGNTRTTWMRTWHNAIKNSGMQGDMYWQFGMKGLSAGTSHDDGYTIYSDEGNYQELVVDWANSRRG